LIRYRIFDRLEISAFLYKPKEEDIIDTTKPLKFGAILSIHGGPTAQEKPLYDYSGLYQYLIVAAMKTTKNLMSLIMMMITRSS
jgi:dipeptidyl aminopeptidase/acylaminoacyl peptidase